MGENFFKVEYIWIDGYGSTRSKTKVIFSSAQKLSLTDLSDWNYDGSSTGQASSHDSEVIIRPQVIYPDPFRGDHDLLVLCDTWLPNGLPHPTNTRVKAMKIFDKDLESNPLFGLEQEFFLSQYNRPIGFPDNSYPSPQKMYYCGIGGDNAIGRECIEEAFEKCLQAGLKLSGLNAEVAPSQWEFQVCQYGIAVADELYIMRYIISRVAEKYDLNLDLRPKPISGDWNGSGCHVNFSTEKMRNEGGYEIILEAIHKLAAKHNEHIAIYGKDNNLRLTGIHETARMDKFTFGVADRAASVRIPRETKLNNCGYFEDRRPASNIDPYLVCSKIFETTCL